MDANGLICSAILRIGTGKKTLTSVAVPAPTFMISNSILLLATPTPSSGVAQPGIPTTNLFSDDDEDDEENDDDDEDDEDDEEGN